MKAKERFARIFTLLLAISNPYLIKILCTRKRGEIYDNNNTPMITRIFLMKLFKIMKETLTFHQWLKMENFPKSDFEVKRNTNDSRASKRIKNCLESYKQIIDCGGNGF